MTCYTSVVLSLLHAKHTGLQCTPTCPAVTCRKKWLREVHPNHDRMCILHRHPGDSEIPWETVAWVLRTWALELKRPWFKFQFYYFLVNLEAPRILICKTGNDAYLISRLLWSPNKTSLIVLPSASVSIITMLIELSHNWLIISLQILSCSCILHTINETDHSDL